MGSDSPPPTPPNTIKKTFTFEFFNVSKNYFLDEHYSNYQYEKGTIIWIDPAVYNAENSGYKRTLDSTKCFDIYRFKNVDESIEKLKDIKFQKTFIIVSGSYSIEFFTKIEAIVNDLSVMPKIIIFTSSKRYIEIKQKILNLDKYDLFDINLVFEFFDPVLNELKIKENNENYINYNQAQINKENENIFMFEYIKESNQLIFPLYLTEYFNIPNKNEIKDFNIFLLKNYSGIKNLIEQLLLKTKIPIQVLIKYWLRAYTYESNFYKDMNNYLIERFGEQYDPYITILYYGLKKNYISPCIDKDLYRGGSISKDELKYINNSLAKKKKSSRMYLL